MVSRKHTDHGTLIFRPSWLVFSLKIFFALVVALFLFSLNTYLTHFLTEFYQFFKVEEIFKIKIAKPEYFSYLSKGIVLLIILQPLVPFIIQLLFAQFTSLHIEEAMLKIIDYTIGRKNIRYLNSDSIQSYKIQKPIYYFIFKTGAVDFTFKGSIDDQPSNRNFEVKNINIIESELKKILKRS